MRGDRVIPSQRHLFDIPPDVAYLNCAYMSPLMHEVLAAGQAGLARKARPWTIGGGDFFDPPEEARALFAGLVGGDAEGVAIVPAASYGIATAAANLPLKPGQRILVAADQFPSNRHAWAALARRRGAELLAVDGPDLTEAFLAAIDERCAIVACAQCRWTDGARVDLDRLAPAVRAAGAALVLDLTQSAGAMPVDLGRIDPDFAVAATYKWLLGPYSLGFLHVAARHRDGRPLEEGWMNRAGSEDFARLVRPSERYRPGARRFDMGEVANFALLPAAIAAMRRIREWGVDAIAATLAARNAQIAARAAGLGLAALPEARRAGHFLGLRLPGPARADLARALAGEGVHVSVRGDMLRVTPHLWVEAGDVDRFIAALARLV